MIPEEPKAPNDVSNQFEGPAGGTGHPLIDQGRDARKSNGSEPDANGAVGLPLCGEQQDSRPAGPSNPEEPKAASQKEGGETCEVCGRDGCEQFEMREPWPQLFEVSEHWRLGYERQRAENDRLRDRMVAAFGEGTDETHLVEISHEHERDLSRADRAEAEVLRLTKERDEARENLEVMGAMELTGKGALMLNDHAMKRADEAEAERERLTKEVQQAREHLIGAYRQGKKPIDHACEQCAPYSEILVPGFVCWWHAGEALAVAPPNPSLTPSDK